MIQRIQSVYLFIAIILMLSRYFTNWVVYSVGEDATTFGDTSTALILYLAQVASIVLCSIAVFQFKARGRQMGMVRWTMLSEAAVLVVFAIVHYVNIQSFLEDGELSMTYDFSAALPLINIVLLWLAHRAIKKDDDLVKSVDRLR